MMQVALNRLTCLGIVMAVASFGVLSGCKGGIDPRAIEKDGIGSIDQRPTSGGGEDPTGINAAVGGDCTEVVFPAEIKGGCNIRLVTPQACAEVDLANGRTYEVAWTTSGTVCETPYKVYLAGNPPTDGNIKEWHFSENASQGITRNGGGAITMDASALDGLTSNNGIYHWLVVGWHGSHPASFAFKVRK